MSREEVEAVRQEIAVSARSHRRLEERLGLRFPRALARLAQAVFRLSSRSPLRQAAIRRVARLGMEATNRGDFEAAFMLYHSEVEVIEPAQVVGLGLDPISHGREGRIHVQRRWNAEWQGLRLEPKEVIDLGDRLLVLSRMKGIGTNSGAAFDTDVVNVLLVSGGQVIREEIFLDRAEALEAVGLSE